MFIFNTYNIILLLDKWVLTFETLIIYAISVCNSYSLSSSIEDEVDWHSGLIIFFNRKR